MRKSQVTIFIALSLVILFVFIFFINISSINNNADVISDKGLLFIKNYIDNCVKSTSEDAVSTLGWQGGRINYDPNKMMSTHFGAITYSYDEGKNTLPSVEKMEKEMEIYVDTMLDICIENETIYQGWIVEKGKLNTLTTITGNSVLFEVDYPMRFKKEKITKKISEFITTVPVRLGHIRSVVHNITEVQVEEPGWLPYTYLDNFDLSASLYLYRKNNFVYEFIDDKSLIRNKPFQFIVATKFKDRNPEEVFNEIINNIE